MCCVAGVSIRVLGDDVGREQFIHGITHQLSIGRRAIVVSAWLYGEISSFTKRDVSDKSRA